MMIYTAISDTSNSLVANAHLISKVFFPRMIIPVAAAMVSLVDFAISLGILALLMLWYQYLPDLQILLLPIFIAMAFLASLGPALLITALNVKYRDFRYIIPFIVQFGLFVSPVGFSSNVVPDDWRLIYSINPMVGVIDGFRWSILGAENQLYIPGFAASLAMTGIFLVFGVRQFRKMEKTF